MTRAQTIGERLVLLADDVHETHPLLAVNMRDAARFYRRREATQAAWVPPRHLTEKGFTPHVSGDGRGGPDE